MRHRFVFTVVAVLVLMGGLLWAGPQKESKEAPAGAQTKAAAPGKYQEAPMLAALVQAGKLPPVEQRLPPEPVVIKPYEEVGQYGGTIRTFATQANHPGDNAYAGGGFETIFRLTLDLKNIIPNIAAGYKYSDDAKSLTISLRKGMKWSDGEPFAADDVMYWWNDEILNDDITPAKPTAWWAPGGKLMTVVKIDDYTVQFQFAVPYPVAALLLAGPEGYGKFQSPSHWLKQYHLKYNPKAQELAKAAGFDFWYQYYTNRKSAWCTLPLTVGHPTLGPYILKDKTTNLLTYERNPYYWKVDTAGNQLPYIDSLVTNKVENTEIYNAKIVSGEADYATRYSSIDNYSLYKESAAKADYRVLLWPTGFGSQIIYQPNETTKDPVLRDLFRTAKFRQALSLAINRKEINESLFFGLGTPRQWTLISSSSLYDPKYGEAYASYDPAAANKLLDEIGLKWDGSHQFRLRPDGKKLFWTLDIVPTGPSMGSLTAMSELVKEYWAKIGVDVAIKPISSELAGQRGPANEYEMNAWTGDRGTDMAFFTGDIRWFVPQTLGWEGSFGIEWARWYTTQGKQGEEPPAQLKQIYSWLTTMTTSPDEKTRREAGKNILQSQADNVYVIGTVGMIPQAVMVKNNLRNIPEKHVYTWDYLYTNFAAPEQFFFKQK